LLDKLQRVESRLWAEEEASLKADDIDSDLEGDGSQLSGQPPELTGVRQAVSGALVERSWLDSRSFSNQQPVGRCAMAPWPSAFSP
jgi:hypothetical protein